MAKIIFKDAGAIDVKAGVTVLEAALLAKIDVHHTCGGNASCSTCRVRVLEGAQNLTPIESAEAQVLDTFDLKSPFRLSCQAAVTGGEVTIEIPVWSRTPRPNKTPKIPQ